MSRTKLKTKKLADFPKPYRDLLAHFAAFRQLGFGADDLFVGFGTVSGEPDILHMQLATQGQTFTVMVAQLRGESRVKVIQTWEVIAALANEAPQAEREVCFRGHLIGSSLDYFVAFTQAIEAKGIRVPEMVMPAVSRSN